MEGLIKDIIKKFDINIPYNTIYEGYVEELEHINGRFALNLSNRDIVYIALTHLDHDPMYYYKLKKYVEKN